MRGTPLQVLEDYGSASSVHPRLCGEHHATSTRPGSRDGGSSPPVRGTLPSVASSTVTSARGSSPPVRGTRTNAEYGTGPRTAGSSPPVRGTLSKAHIRQAFALKPVHPRLCGEHLLTTGGCRVLRFIPACAGNTCQAAMASRLRSVHPRLCGEHLSDKSNVAPLSAGSSPPVRGTPPVGLPACPCIAVHPRLCGEHAARHRWWVESPRRTVHPRLCGEHDRMTKLGSAFHRQYPGSSPPVRGTHFVVLTRRLSLRHRFIPACAGNTAIPLSRTSPLNGHIPACAGSSPPVRGTPARTVLAAAPLRTGSSPPVRGTRMVFTATWSRSFDGSSPPVRGTQVV